jgi:RHS repeat-associated protein
VNSTTTIYDAFNRLVEMQTPSGNTQIVYAPDGFKFAYMNGQTIEKYIAPLTAGMQAVYTAATPAPPAYWRHADWLGSSRLASSAQQTVYYDGMYAPFGEPYGESGTLDRSFTGQNQDLADGIYDFPLRQYDPGQGRWLVPDPAGLGAVDMTNPQTWNRYAYVGNNPLNAIDPKGLHFCASDDYSCQGMDGGGGGGGGGELEEPPAAATTLAGPRNTPWMVCPYRGPFLGPGSEQMT